MKEIVAGLIAGLVCCLSGAAVGGENSSFKTLRLEGHPVRWQATAGQRPVVSYAIVVADVAYAGARNCRKLTTLDGLLAASEIPAAKAREEIAAAFTMWEAVANISFQEAKTPALADIVIGAQAESEGWAFADVFYDVTAPQAVKPISQALICLNPARRWKVGFDGDLRAYDLRYTLAHEIGHAIGLDHPSGAGQIMGYRYGETFRELQSGDIAGAVQLYGTRQADAVMTASAPSSMRSRGSLRARLHAKRWGTRAFTARPH